MRILGCACLSEASLVGYVITILTYRITLLHCFNMEPFTLFQNISGHYMYMDPYQHPVYGSSSSSYHGPTRYARMTSPEFPPSTEYCVRFMYTMYGTDVKTLNVYAKVFFDFSLTVKAAPHECVIRLVNLRHR